jgi:exonuclease III
MSLFNLGLEKKESDLTTLKIIAWNIQKPSKDRANEQFRWIYDMNPDVIVLTEVTLSEGFALLKTELEMQGYEVMYSECESYFTVIAIRSYIYEHKHLNMDYFSPRVNYIEIQSPIGVISIVGVYAPTCSREDKKITSKIRFHEELYNEVIRNIWNRNPYAKIMVLGDLNFLEPDHKPIYNDFFRYYKYYRKFNEKPFKDLYRVLNPEALEYSWSGQGLFQRLDHIFSTENILPFVNKVEYLHKPRKSKLSDHSVLYVEIVLNKK